MLRRRGRDSGRQEAGPESPSRRAFSRLLLAGTGLAALSACTPAQSYTPSGTPGSTPGLTPGMDVRRRRRRRAVGLAGKHPAGDSDARDVVGCPAVGRGVPSIGRGARAATFAHGPHQPVGDCQQAPAALPRHLCAAGSGPAGRAAGHLGRGGAAEQYDGGRGGEDVRGGSSGGRHHYPGQRLPFVRDADGYLRRLREFPGTGRGRHRFRPAGPLRAPDGLGVRHWRWKRRRRFTPQFKDRPAAIWAKTNAHRFGFVVRYPWMLHKITGYFYEPWHLRFIGAKAATDMSARGIGTLEQYFGLEAAPAYR